MASGDRRGPFRAGGWMAGLALAGQPVLAAPPGGVAELPPNAEVITREELRDGLFGYDLFDVLAALARRAGITVKSSSDVGAEDWLLVRGLPRDSARNVLVLIDGMPLNDAASEANEFEHLPPVELIERIVVYRPPLPARFGGYHAVIEVRTRRGPQREGARGEVAMAGGSRGTRMASVGAEGRAGRVSWLASLDHLRTDNLTGVRRTPPKADQVYGDRSYRRTKPAAKVTYGDGAGGLAFYGQYVTSRKFFSDEIFRGERERRDRRLAAFNLAGWVRPSEAMRIEWNLFRADERYRLNLRMHPSVRDQDRYKQGARVTWTWAPSPRQRLLAGGEVTESYARERLGTPRPLTRLTRSGLFVEYALRPAERLTVELGARRDGLSRAASRWSGSAALRVRPDARTELYALWSRTVRWPALSEVASWDPALPVEGERLQGGEVGLRRRLAGGRAHLRLSAFDLRLRGEAKFVMDRSRFPPFFGYRPQADEVRSRGLELALDTALSARWRAFANLTYNAVERRPGGRPVDFSGPRRLANAGLRYGDGRLTVDLAGRYGGRAEGVQAMGGRPTALAAWFLVDAAVRFRAARHLEAFARGSNLLDRRYETFDGRPMFGRVVVAGISARW